MPYFPFYAQDFLTSERVQLMSLEARGAYVTLLAQEWIKGDLPADSLALARLCGCHSEAFEAIWPELAPSFVEKGGRLTNRRLEDERTRACAKRQRHVEAGKRGAQVRWSQQDDSAAIATPKPRHSKAIASSESEADTESDITTCPSDPRLVHALIAAWVEVQPARPAEADIRKQGAAARRIAAKHGAEQIAAALTGIENLFPHSQGEPWDLFDLERKFPKAVAAVNGAAGAPRADQLVRQWALEDGMRADA